MADDDDAEVKPATSGVEGGDNTLQMRSYDLYITYDRYYQVNKLFRTIVSFSPFNVEGFCGEVVGIIRILELVSNNYYYSFLSLSVLTLHLVLPLLSL